MTKSELIEKLAAAEGITLRAAEVAVNVTFESIASVLARGERIEVRGFGSLKIKDYESYQGRNPKSGEPITIEAKKLPIFKVGKELKDRVDGRQEEQSAAKKI